MKSNTHGCRTGVKSVGSQDLIFYTSFYNTLNCVKVDMSNPELGSEVMDGAAGDAVN